jgi:hypothetical protein
MQPVADVALLRASIRRWHWSYGTPLSRAKKVQVVFVMRCTRGTYDYVFELQPSLAGPDR